MKYYIENNKIIVPEHDDFNAKHILECGQVFRFKTTSFGYEVYSLHHKASVYCQKDKTVIECSDVNYFIKYFDLETDYAKIKLELQNDSLLKEAISYGKGIRILKQDHLEMIISFIISANNNIPRIKQIIENICQQYGKQMDGYFAFPTLSELKKIPKQFFTDIKAGYRDKYLFGTISAISDGFDINAVGSMPTQDAVKHLMQLPGVGPKVADCILLFGYYNTNIFPSDTWIKKVYYDYNTHINHDEDVNAYTVRNYFINKFGSLSGYAQQYLFYSKRKK